MKERFLDELRGIFLIDTLRRTFNQRVGLSRLGRLSTLSSQSAGARRLARSAPTDYSVFNAADKRPLAVVDVASAHAPARRSVTGILELDIISACAKRRRKWRIAQAGGINGRYHARSNHADRVRLHGGKAPVRRQRDRAVRGADRRSGDA